MIYILPFFLIILHMLLLILLAFYFSILHREDQEKDSNNWLKIYLNQRPDSFLF